MPRPRLTIRRLMIAVAVVAVILAFVEGRRRRFSRVAEAYSPYKVNSSDLYILLIGGGEKRIVAAIEQRHQWRENMHKKYRWAADHPWLPLMSDPPEPIIPK